MLPRPSGAPLFAIKIFTAHGGEDLREAVRTDLAIGLEECEILMDDFLREVHQFSDLDGREPLLGEEDDL